MVDWRSAQVSSARSGVSRSIEGYARKLEGEVNVQDPARIWVERQENKPVANEPERLPTTSECGHHLLRIVTGWKQGIEVAAEGASWRTADPSRYPERERVCCLLVLNLVSSTLPCIRQPRPRLLVQKAT